MKRIFSLLLVLLILCTVPLTASAHDYVQMDRTDCSIEVLVYYKNNPINSGTLTAIKVGYVAEDDGNYFFCQELTDEVLEDIQFSSAVKDLQNFYEDNKKAVSFEKKTVSIRNGSAKFENLTPGLYLIIQENASNGFDELNAFLVSVPYMQDGKYQYHVTANAKSSLEQEPIPTEPTGDKLPQTGQLNWPVPILASTGLLFIALGWMLISGRKKNAHEK